jgi:hypothetical protein
MSKSDTTNDRDKELDELRKLARHIADDPYALTPDQWASEARLLIPKEES